MPLSLYHPDDVLRIHEAALSVLAQQHSGDRERFMTYFEAFVVFGRSVLHVLRNAVDVAGVFSCFAPEWNVLGRAALPEFFRDNRDIVLREGVEGTRRPLHQLGFDDGNQPDRPVVESVEDRQWKGQWLSCNTGAGDEIRTRDLRITSALLYH